MIRFSNTMRFACLSAALLLAACEHKPVATTQEAPPMPPPVAHNEAPPPPMPGIRPGSIEDFRTNVGDTVHFAYNQYNVQGEDQAMLGRQAQWLSRYPQVRVTVEGHADERGTREYNLALGARRANAVKEYLVGQGVASSRVETVSYGKERPICTESTESCWAQNRRGVTTISAGAAS